jgi:chloramphenicol O-acetyltransferase
MKYLNFNKFIIPFKSRRNEILQFVNAINDVMQEKNVPWLKFNALPHTSTKMGIIIKNYYIFFNY